MLMFVLGTKNQKSPLVTDHKTFFFLYSKSFFVMMEFFVDSLGSVVGTNIIFSVESYDTY